ncbi:unnamed protein product [Ectocarpus sp. 6 AP-2014]
MRDVSVCGICKAAVAVEVVISSAVAAGRRAGGVGGPSCCGLLLQVPKSRAYGREALEPSKIVSIFPTEYAYMHVIKFWYKWSVEWAGALSGFSIFICCNVAKSKLTQAGQQYCE